MGDIHWNSTADELQCTAHTMAVDSKVEEEHPVLAKSDDETEKTENAVHNKESNEACEELDDKTNGDDKTKDMADEKDNKKEDSADDKTEDKPDEDDKKTEDKPDEEDDKLEDEEDDKPEDKSNGNDSSAENEADTPRRGRGRPPKAISKSN